MAAYYFLVSSLPTISLREPGDTPPLGTDEFLAACLAHVTEERLLDIQAVLDGEPQEAAHPAAKLYAHFESQLQNAVQARRAAARGSDASLQLQDHEGWSVALEKAVEQAFLAAHPLAREMALDKAREQFLDDLATADPFGAGFVLAYAGKLRLAIRWSTWNVEKGRLELEALGRLGLEALQRPGDEPLGAQPAA